MPSEDLRVLFPLPHCPGSCLIAHGRHLCTQVPPSASACRTLFGFARGGSSLIPLLSSRDALALKRPVSVKRQQGAKGPVDVNGNPRARVSFQNAFSTTLGRGQSSSAVDRVSNFRGTTPRGVFIRPLVFWGRSRPSTRVPDSKIPPIRIDPLQHGRKILNGCAPRAGEIAVILSGASV